MNKSNNLTFFVLNAACDDYENIASLQADVENALNSSIEIQAIYEVSMQLARNGYLDIYILTDGGNFTGISPEESEQYCCVKLWFYITGKGRDFIDHFEAK